MSYLKNKVSPKRDVTILARDALSAGRQLTHGNRPTRPSAALQMMTDDDDRQQTPAAKQYWPIRRASNKNYSVILTGWNLSLDSVSFKIRCCLYVLSVLPKCLSPKCRNVWQCRNVWPPTNTITYAWILKSLCCVVSVLMVLWIL